MELRFDDDNERSEALKSVTAGSRRGHLDRALAGPAFRVDAMACASAAQILRGLDLAGRAPDSDRPRSSELLLRLSVAAVCHQINWDFVSSRLALAFDEFQGDPRFLSSVTARHVAAWLAGYRRAERIRARERAAFLRDVGKIVVGRYSGDAELLLIESKGRLHGPGGLLARLDDFSAFSKDPLRKKSNVFAHEVIRDRLGQFADQDKIAPAVDYHIMRLYLRSGRVVPIHGMTFTLLKTSFAPRPRLVKLMREAVSEALSLTALYAGMSIPEVNELEWEIGRGVCERAKPQCESPSAEAPVAFLNGRRGCLYRPFCRAFGNPEWRKLKEPELRKSFY
jgi:hypothetical protein